MSHVYQSHLTVVIGNPNKEMQTVIAQEAKDQGGMEEDVWFDYVREQFKAGTTQLAPNYMSHIDFMLSTMLGEDVVRKVTNGLTRCTIRTICEITYLLIASSIRTICEITYLLATNRISKNITTKNENKTE